MCDCEEKLKSLEKKIDRAIAIGLETQMMIAHRGESTAKRQQQMKAYISSVSKTFKDKGMDTSLFDNFQNIMDG